MQKKSPRTGITHTILLDHMHGMEHRLRMEFKNSIDSAINTSEQRLRTEIRASEQRTSERIAHLGQRLTFQIDAIDQRLDAVEIENLPKRVTRLEKAVGIR